MKGTREHIKPPNGQSSSINLTWSNIFDSNKHPGKSYIWNKEIKENYHGEGNVEGGHEEITKSKVGNEEVGDGVKPACLDDDTEDKEVTKERYNDNEATDNHDEIVQSCKLILEILDWLNLDLGLSNLFFLGEDFLSYLDEKAFYIYFQI